MFLPSLAAVSCSTCLPSCSSATHPAAPGEWFSRTQSLQVQENHLTFQTQSLSYSFLLPTGGFSELHIGQERGVYRKKVLRPNFPRLNLQPLASSWKSPLSSSPSSYDNHYFLPQIPRKWTISRLERRPAG